MSRAATLADLFGSPTDILAHAAAVLTAVDALGHQLAGEIAKPDKFLGHDRAQHLCANIIDLSAVASALVRGAAADADIATMPAQAAARPVPNSKLES